MKIQIKLDEKNNIGSLVESGPFLLLDEDKIEIEFLTEFTKKPMLLASIRNGDGVKQFIVKNNLLILSQDFVKEGDIDIVISLYTGTAVGKKWICEPIKIINAKEVGFEAYSKIDAALKDLQIRIEECLYKISAFEKANNFKLIALETKIGEHNSALQKQIDELWQTQEQ